MKTIAIDNDRRRLLLDDIVQVLDFPRLFVSDKCLFYLGSSVNIDELSRVLKKTVASIVSFFWNKGQKVTRNQNLSEEALSNFCSSIGLTISSKKISFNSAIEKYLKSIDLKEFDFRDRTVVVSVMGHIDHGKTSLVDNVCHTNIQRKEKGGITQKISTSLVEFQKRKILFLDTPGHSDFIRLRKRGISLTDVVILVIDSLEGVMLQTEEIIDYIHQYSLPVLVFINQKNDKKLEDDLKTWGQLQERGLVPLEWQGETIILTGSAKNPVIVPTLLENILLLVNCQANFSGPVFGVFIDSYLHSRFNSMISKVLIQGGVLKSGDYLFAGGRIGQIKTMSREESNKIMQLKSANPGEVVLITGFGHALELGEKFVVISRNEFQELSKKIKLKKAKFKNLAIPDFFSAEKKNVNLFLLADSENSLQTIVDLVKKKTHDDIFFNVAGLSVGQLHQTDLELALITNSVLLVFNVDVDSFISTYVKENKLTFFSSGIIYEIDKFLDIVIENQKTKEKTVSEIKKGEAIIKIVYSFSKGNIAGCRVIEGIIERSSKVYLFRENKKIYTGKIKSLEIERNVVKEAKVGQDCGIVLNKFNDYKTGDLIIAFQTNEN